MLSRPIRFMTKLWNDYYGWLVLLMVAIFCTFGLISGFQQAKGDLTKAAEDDVARARLQSRIRDLEVAQSRDAELIDSVTSLIATPELGKGVLVPGKGRRMESVAEQIFRRQDDLDTRIASLERALATTPEKALALPLLSQELNDVKSQSRGDLESIRNDLSRLYTTIQWAVGILVATVVGFVGFTASLKRSKDAA